MVTQKNQPTSWSPISIQKYLGVSDTCVCNCTILFLVGFKIYNTLFLQLMVNVNFWQVTWDLICPSKPMVSDHVYCVCQWWIFTTSPRKKWLRLCFKLNIWSATCTDSESFCLKTIKSHFNCCPICGKTVSKSSSINGSGAIFVQMFQVQNVHALMK